MRVVEKWSGAHYLKLVCVVFFLSSGYGSAYANSASHIVKSLPGYVGPRLPFHLETGYIGVDEKEDVQYFYYYIQSEGNPNEYPILLWLTGGPACSALSGLVFEIGPIRFNMVEYNGSLPTFVLNPHSWTQVASIIFLDAPVGTGFSYSKNLQSSQTGDTIYASRTYSFLRKWLIRHPEFINNPVYIGGDSYSGIIVPLVAREISDGIEAKHDPPINLKGYLLGNPATDIKYDGNSKIPFANRMALISDELYKSTKRTCKGEYLRVGTKNVECHGNLHTVSECTRGLYSAHILEPKCHTDKIYISIDNRTHLSRLFEVSLFSESQVPRFGCRDYNNLLCTIWANDPTVQMALNIRKGTVKVWIRCKKDLPYKKDVPSVLNHHLDLSTRGYRALIYSGDHDMVVPYLGTYWWIKSLNLTTVDVWRAWLVDGQVAGYVEEYANNFTFATIKGGGHTAPEYKAKECFAMFNRWISAKSL